MRDWRVLTWVIVVVNVLFLAMMWSGLAGSGEVLAECAGDEFCEAGSAIGTGIGAGIVLFLWVMVDMILGIVWLVTNNRGRECPTCGRKVKKGRTSCAGCGYDYTTGATAAPA